VAFAAQSELRLDLFGWSHSEHWNEKSRSRLPWRWLRQAHRGARLPRASRGRRFGIWRLRCCFRFWRTGVARASVALLMEEPYGDLGQFDPTGHAAVYLNHVCAASPIELRPCERASLAW